MQVLNLINDVETAETALETAQGAEATAQTNLQTAQNATTDAQSHLTASEMTLSHALTTVGPVFRANDDGTVTGFAASPDDPKGYKATVYKPDSTDVPDSQ